MKKFLLFIGLVLVLGTLTLYLESQVRTLGLLWLGLLATLFLAGGVVLLTRNYDFAKYFGILAIVIGLLFAIGFAGTFGWDNIIPPPPPTALIATTPIPQSTATAFNLRSMLPDKIALTDLLLPGAFGALVLVLLGIRIGTRISRKK